MTPRKSAVKFDLKYLAAFDNPYVRIIVVCKVCNKEQSLKFQGLWKRHYLVHADEKPLKCDYCTKTFVQACNLKKHLQTHNKMEEQVKGVKMEPNYF